MTEPISPIEQRPPTGPEEQEHQVHLPRVTIKFCTQCKWMLRAAYFAQELLSTFSTDLGEVALIPTSGGIFTVTIFHRSEQTLTTQETVLWDRKRDGGFPEVKALKSLVRNVVDPSRDLGHTDRALRKANESTSNAAGSETKAQTQQQPGQEKEKCEDCQ